MITVYETNTTFDAKLAQDLLSFEDIESHIMGGFLQGGIGELQTQNLIRVMADKSDLDKAKEIIRQWQEKKATKVGDEVLNKTVSQKHTSYYKALLALGIAAFILGAYFLMSV